MCLARIFDACGLVRSIMGIGRVGNSSYCLRIVWGRLRVFNSSFEGLIDRYYVQGNCYLLVLSKDGQEFTEEVNLDQYEIAEIGDYVKKEPKTFGYQVILASDSTDNT